MEQQQPNGRSTEAADAFEQRRRWLGQPLQHQVQYNRRSTCASQRAGAQHVGQKTQS